MTGRMARVAVSGRGAEKGLQPRTACAVGLHLLHATRSGQLCNVAHWAKGRRGREVARKPPSLTVATKNMSPNPLNTADGPRAAVQCVDRAGGPPLIENDKRRSHPARVGLPRQRNGIRVSEPWGVRGAYRGAR
jgi:hypothetical protein